MVDASGRCGARRALRLLAIARSGLQVRARPASSCEKEFLSLSLEWAFVALCVENALAHLLLFPSLVVSLTKSCVFRDDRERERESFFVRSCSGKARSFRGGTWRSRVCACGLAAFARQRERWRSLSLSLSFSFSTSMKVSHPALFFSRWARRRCWRFPHKVPASRPPLWNSVEF